MSKPALLADEASRLLAPSCTVVQRIKAVVAGAAVAESRAVKNAAHAKIETGQRILIGLSSLLMLVDPGLRRHVAGLPLLGGSGGRRQSVRSRSQEPRRLRENADVRAGRHDNDGGRGSKSGDEIRRDPGTPYTIQRGNSSRGELAGITYGVPELPRIPNCV